MRSLAWLLAAAAATAAVCCGESGSDSDARLVAIGDLHGDYDKGVRVLVGAGLVRVADADSTAAPGGVVWTGGNATLVQLGDLTDRGPDSSALIDLFEELKPQAAAAGGEIVTLLGNHEYMNLAGDMRYVHPDEFRAAGGRTQRAQLYSPDGAYGRILLGYPAVAVRRGNVFVHAGLLPRFAALGVDALNEMVRDAAAGSQHGAAVLGEHGPLWTRQQVYKAEKGVCDDVRGSLDALNGLADNSEPKGERVSRIVVGHTIQRGGRLATMCDGAFVATDIAMSSYIARADYLGYLELTSGEPVPRYPMEETGEVKKEEGKDEL